MRIRPILPYFMFAAAVVLAHGIFAWTNTTYYLTQLTMSAFYTLVVVGLCLLMGYAGQISIGHAAFFALGGYISARLTTLDLSAFPNSPVAQLFMRTGLTVSAQNLYGQTISYIHPLLALLLSVAASALIAFLIGMPVLRLRGHYLAMATLGFGVIVYRFVLGTEFLGGADGISDVPALGLLPGVKIEGGMASRVQNYYAACGLLLAGAFLVANLVKSRMGRAIRSIHGNEEAASAMGIPVARYKLYLFVLSAVYASLAGVFLTHYNGGIGPSEAGIMKSVRYVALLAVGGMGSLWGGIIAGLTLNFLSLRGYFGTYDDAVFGAILVIVMLFSQKGMAGLSKYSGFRKRKEASHGPA